VKPKRRAARRPLSSSRQAPPSLSSQRSLTTSLFAGLAGWVSVALIAVNIAVYAPVAHYEFVMWDDPQYLLDNPHVSGGLTGPGVSWAWTSGYASNWHPLTWWSHMLDVQMYGMSAGPHHVTNLLLHIANTLLLFGLLHAMTGRLWPSAFVAALFAAHPLHVESVAWVSERKDVLSTLFWMLTVWAYLWYLRRRGLGRYSVMAALFVLGLMAKPMLVTLPFVLLLLDVWPLGRLMLGNDSAGVLSSGLAWSKRQRSRAVELAREKLPLIALAAASSIITFVVQRQGGAVAASEALPLGDRVANALVSYMRYIGKMLWPARLAAVYPFSRPVPEWWVVGSLLGFFAISIVAIRAARRYPYVAVGWFWYVGTLVPVIGVIQVGSQAMADRYTYVPLVGLFIIVAWGGVDLCGRWTRRVLPIAAGLAIVACIVVARGQVEHWRNSLALWAHAVDVTDANFIAQNGLGEALAAQGKVDEAIAHFSEAVRLSPDFPAAQNNLGVELKRQRHFGEAIAHYSLALRIRPDFAEAHNNLANALDEEGRTSEAITQYNEALRIRPNYAEAHNGLGVALAKEERLGEAVDHFSAAMRIKPDSVDAYNNLGIALAMQGKREDAIHQFSEALRLSPGNPLARRSLEELTSAGKESR
jgi:tetratricopeptide (TPR) repeat protein